MRLSAIFQARVIAFLDVPDIHPRNSLFFPDITKELVQRYGFQKFPRTLDEWQHADGAQFAIGKAGTITIDALILFNNGIQLDTHAGTSESKRILEEMLEWAQKLGLSYTPGVIQKWAYVSALTFFSDVSILSTPPLDKLAERTSSVLSEILGEAIVYQPAGQIAGHDPLVLKYGRASFTIQRRLDVPFDDNKYFSESPLPTEAHFSILEEFEAGVKRLHEQQRGIK